LIRIVINSFAGCLLLLLTAALYEYNALLAALLALAAVDQFEDVYFYAFGKRLIPDWLMPVDVLLEGVLIALGVGILLFSLFYYAYFHSWFFRLLMFLSVPIILSGVEDVLYWMRGEEGLGIAIRKEEEFKFVKKK